MVEVQPGVSVPGNAFRVLVVDDNRDAADTLAELLRAWGYDVRVAYDGESGLQAAYACEPDFLLLDINLPRLDGYGLAQEVRRRPEFRRAKLVALSAYSDEAHARRAREAGFDYYYIKPVDLGEIEGLLAMLKDVVKLTSQTEALARQNVALAEETKELIAGVKEDIKEVKEELKEVKKEIQEVKEGINGGPPG